MEAKRKFYPKKWQWAEAKLDELYDQLNAPRDYIPSADWRKIRQRSGSRDHLFAEISRVRRMAERFKAADQ